MLDAYLELVLAGLSGWGRVEEIDCENLFRQHHVSIWSPKSINQAIVRPHSISMPPTTLQSEIHRDRFIVELFVARSCAKFRSPTIT
jgi:hypothetical protein